MYFFHFTTMNRMHHSSSAVCTASLCASEQMLKFISRAILRGDQCKTSWSHNQNWHRLKKHYSTTGITA